MENKYEKEKFSKIISESINYTDACRNLKIGLTYGNRQTIKNYIDEYKLDINHFYIPSNSGSRKKLDLDNILIKNSSYKHTTNLKNKLYKEGLKQRSCELCGQGEEWMGKKMSLILDHINGVNNDNRIENLRIVCSNCNATLDTHGGKNKHNFELDIIKKEKKDLEKFEKEVERLNNNGKTIKQKESAFNQRKIERPDNETLIKEIEELGYSATGRKYGVSDNAIRKWLK